MKVKKNLIFFVLIIFIFVIIGLQVLSFFKKKEMKNLDKNLQMGISSLFVKDLEKMTDFYNQIIGLDILEKNENSTTLGKNSIKTLKLEHRSNLNFPNSTSAGLYHNAILYSNKTHLAKTLQNILTKSAHSYEGSGDHSVSQAFYFRDPEGNGLELYFDRPKSDWKWNEGKVVMGTEYIDVNQFIQENLNKSAAEESKIGHVHLKVGDISLAKRFYVDTLGFDITAEMPTALFISSGGYHHHLGMNTWESLGAGKRSDSYGLKSFEIILSNSDELENIKLRLKTNNIEFNEIKNGIEVSDPWENKVIFIYNNI